MIVCVCRKVSDRQIRQAVADGAHSLECLQIDLGVATQCGRCADCASRVLCEARGAGTGTGTGTGTSVRAHVITVSRGLQAQMAMA
jgi:bacterioferritin-associated ferredoxin